MKNVIIMGGYGNVGSLLASRLLQHIPEFHFTLAGRNESRAKEMAEKLMKDYPGNKVSTCFIDAGIKETMIDAFANQDMVIVASSSLKQARTVIEAAIETNTDYYDTQLSSQEKIDILNEYKIPIEDNKLTFITDGGYHPGIPGTMIKWAKQKLGDLYKANVYAALKMDWSLYEYTTNTNHEMLEELTAFNSSHFVNKEWKKVEWSKIPTWDFKEPYGELACTPMLMEEIRCAPEEISEINETGFFISGFNPLMNNFLLPVLMIGVNILPKSMYGPLGKLFEWGLKKSKPPFGVMLDLDAEGSGGSLQLKVAHEDGYEITVVPIVACLKQYNSGLIKHGLHLQAWAVEPEQFFNDIKEMGIDVSETISTKEAIHT